MMRVAEPVHTRAPVAVWVVVLGMFALVMLYAVVYGPKAIAGGSSYCNRADGGICRFSTDAEEDIVIPPILKLSKDWLGR